MNLRLISASLGFALALVCGLHAADAEVKPAAEVPAAEALPAPSDYAFFPGDVLHIQVFDHADLTTVIRLPADGVITFPLIGEVRSVVGRNSTALSGEIAQRLLDGYIRKADVTITIMEFGRRSASVLGSVRGPREMPLDPLRRTTALEAIAASGGFSENANRTGTHIVRNDPVQAGTKIAIPVPVAERNDVVVPDVILQPGDLVVVPRLDQVYVIGQVVSPSALAPPDSEPLTVSKAIAMAGGFQKFAKQDQIQLIRNGKRIAVIDIRAILLGDASHIDPVVEPGDTIFVPESRL